MASSTLKQNYKVPSTSKVSVDKLLRVGCYDLEKTIGKGNFAVVKLASNIITKTKTTLPLTIREIVVKDNISYKDLKVVIF
ncbi:Serine/threonine-protein kinase SIK1 [Lucilia cuprina]|nr:Serine/threonine-protein kinase SIK1 [Lucilia cuprina]